MKCVRVGFDNHACSIYSEPGCIVDTGGGGGQQASKVMCNGTYIGMLGMQSRNLIAAATSE